MEPETGRGAKKALPRWLIPALLALLILAVAALAVVLITRGTAGDRAAEESSPPRIGYAEGTTVVDDPDALQAAVDEMLAKAGEPGVGLEYKNDAVSYDGVNFDCYIANAGANQYDMYIDIYADAEMTDEVFLSELMRPGTAFEKVTLNRALETGNHLVYVAFTQVEDVDGEQTIHAQVVATMNFIVRE